MDEQSHDKVSGRMHEPRGMVRPAFVAPILASDSNEMTAIDNTMLGSPPPAPLMIESRKLGRSSDDDPTTLVVRDDAPSRSSLPGLQGPPGQLGLQGPPGLQQPRVQPSGPSGPHDRPSIRSPVLAPLPTKLPGSAGYPRLDDGFATETDQANIPTAVTTGTGTSAPRPSRLSIIVAFVIVAVASAAAGLYVGSLH
jgi:hypothetical protein